MRRALEPLREREFRLLFLGRTVSFAGSAIAPIALAFAILDDLDRSATALGIVLAAGWAPQIVFVLIGGVWADRLPRNVVMVGSNLLSGAVQLVTAALLLAGSADLWQLAALQVARGIATSFFFPASQGIVPLTVSASRLQEANALLRLSLNAVNIGGAAIGGVLVATIGSGWTIAFDGATYLASAALLAGMHIGGRVQAEASRFLGELREGWDEFWSRTWLWSTVAGATFGNMARLGGFFVLGPLVAEESLGGPAAWGAILACEGAGLIAGGLLALRWRPARPLRAGTLVLLGAAAVLALLAVPAPLALIAAGAAAAGFGLELFSVYWDTAMQQHVPTERLSRVASYDALGSFVAIPIGLTLAGPLADAIGVSATLWLAAATALGGCAGPLLSSQVRGLPRLPEPVESAAA